MKRYVSVEINAVSELKAAMNQIDRVLGGGRGKAFVRFPDGTLVARRDRRGVWRQFVSEPKRTGDGARPEAWGA